MGLDRVQEASVPVFGADEADPVQGSVIRSVLVGLHLRKQNSVPRSSALTRFLSRPDDAAAKFGVSSDQVKADCFEGLV